MVGMLTGMTTTIINGARGIGINAGGSLDIPELA